MLPCVPLSGLECQTQPPPCTPILLGLHSVPTGVGGLAGKPWMSSFALALFWRGAFLQYSAYGPGVGRHLGPRLGGRGKPVEGVTPAGAAHAPHSAVTASLSACQRCAASPKHARHEGVTWQHVGWTPALVPCWKRGKPQAHTPTRPPPAAHTADTLPHRTHAAVPAAAARAPRDTTPRGHPWHAGSLR